MGRLTMSAEPREWKHRTGDRYIAASAHIIGTPAKYETVYHDHGTFDRLSRAISAGFRAIQCDDFNVGVVRGGKLVARLWMREVVDEEPDELAGMAGWLGLEVAT